MDIKTEFNIGDWVYTIDYVSAIGKPYCHYVVEKEKYRIDGMKIHIISYGEKVETSIEYWNDKHTRYFIAFKTEEQAQIRCEELNGKIKS